MSTAITDLAAAVVDAARSSQTMIMTVESCTAGSLATLFADTPHAGDVLLGGLVTYAKACKTELLGISPSSLSSCSAVSSEVVTAMLRVVHSMSALRLHSLLPSRVLAVLNPMKTAIRWASPTSAFNVADMLLAFANCKSTKLRPGAYVVRYWLRL